MTFNGMMGGALIVLASALAASPAGRAQTKPDATAVAREFARDVAFLAADDMDGRGLGTAGLGRAADWIEKRLRAMGLAPAFGRSYRQPFRVKAGVALGAPGADGRPANELEGAFSLPAPDGTLIRVAEDIRLLGIRAIAAAE